MYSDNHITLKIKKNINFFHFVFADKIHECETTSRTIFPFIVSSDDVLFPYIIVHLDSANNHWRFGVYVLMVLFRVTDNTDL